MSLTSAEATSVNNMCPVANAVSLGTAVKTLQDSGASVGDNISLGESGTAGSWTVYPTTASKGYVKFTATDSSGDYDLNLTNEAMAADRTLKIPDPGANTGQFVVTNADKTVVIAPGAADRTLTLSGDGTLALGGFTLTLAGNLTTAGAYSTQFTFPAAHTYTFPDADCTLAAEAGDSSGTTSATFEVDNDSAAAKIGLDTNSATGDFTAWISPANLTADRRLTIADASGTVMVLDNGGSQTAAGDFVWTGTADFQGNITASSGNPSIDLSGSSGAFKTPSGLNTLSGDVSIDAGKDFDMSGGAGTFATGTGTVTINGDTTIAGSKTFTTGTGAVTIKGDLSIDSGKDFDMSAGAGTFATGTGAVGINGAVTLAADVNVTASAGTTEIDLSSGTGTFKTTTGAHTLNGAVTVNDATTPSITTAAGKTNTGFVQVNGKTSGGIKILPPDAGTNLATLSMEAQTQACTFKFPDLNVATGQVVCTSSDFGLTVDLNGADRSLGLTGDLAAAGNVIIAATDFQITGAHTLDITISGDTVLTLPTSGTLTTLDGTEALTNKTIDAASNTVSNLYGSQVKQGVVGVRGGAAPVAAIPICLTFAMDNTAGSSTWTNDTGDTVRLVDFKVVKANGAGGAGDTVQLLNGANAITNTIDLEVDDTDIAGGVADTDQVNDAYVEIANGGTLVCTTVQGGSDASCIVGVTLMRV